MSARPIDSIRNPKIRIAATMKEMAAQLHRLDRRSLDRHPPEPEDQPDGDDQSAEQDREVTRTHARGGAEGEIGTEAEPGETDEHEHQPAPRSCALFTRNMRFPPWPAS